MVCNGGETMKLEIGAKSIKEFKDLLALSRYLRTHKKEIKELMENNTENLKELLTHAKKIEAAFE
jgi:hypothetical protein